MPDIALLAEAPFEEPWQAQAFALAVELNRLGHFTWSEWAAALAEAIATRPDRSYWESWLAALEALTLRGELTGAAALAERKAAWERAYHATPHGRPVVLASA
jgi:nitrile hydratase accessory protein